MMSTLQEDYILAARAKGMPTRHILFREALRPSSFSLITLAGISVGRLIGGTIIVEQVFTLPGLGSVVVTAAQKHDYRVVQGAVLLIALIYVLVNLFVDVGYAYLDPRIRRGRV
jgi:peptide/nickel transport system permease protein